MYNKSLRGVKDTSFDGMNWEPSLRDRMTYCLVQDFLPVIFGSPSPCRPKTVLKPTLVCPIGSSPWNSGFDNEIMKLFFALYYHYKMYIVHRKLKRPRCPTHNPEINISKQN